MPKQTSNKKTNSNKSKPQAKKKQGGASVVQNKTVPVSQSRGLISRKPVITHSTNGRTVISHSEFISPVVLSTSQVGFNQLLRLRVNPGSEKTFLWLSNIARNYEFYKFKKIEFEYLNRCSTASEGSLIISPDYDGEDGAFANQERMLFDNLGTSDKSFWIDSKISLKPGLMNALYKGHTNMSDARFATTTQDQKTVDCAQVFICSDSSLLNKTIGKLVVHYIVEFWGPQSPTEPINEGGVKFDMINTAGNVQNNSTRPFINGVGLNLGTIQGDTNTEGILSPSVNPSVGPTLETPTAVIGKFVRDYQGVLDVIAQYSTSSGNVKPFIFKSPAVGMSKSGLNTAAGDPASDVLLPQKAGWPINTNTDNPIQKLYVDAKKGDLLKIATSAGSGLQSIQMMMSGFSSVADLL